MFHDFARRVSDENSLEDEYDHSYGPNKDSVFNHEDQYSLTKRHLQVDYNWPSSSSDDYGSGYGRQFVTGAGVGGGSQVKTQSEI